MSMPKLLNRVFSLLVFVAAAIVLSGCFVSEKPLINPTNADYPFTSLTFFAVSDQGDDGDADRITFVRQGDVYVELNKEDEEQYLFVEIGADLYIAQMSDKNDDGEFELLYGIIQIQNDETINILSPMCDNAPEDMLEAIGIVKIDEKYADQCLVTSLDQLKALGEKIINSDIKRDIYKIVNLVK